jgi:hypothetical protein
MGEARIPTPGHHSEEEEALLRAIGRLQGAYLRQCRQHDLPSAEFYACQYTIISGHLLKIGSVPITELNFCDEILRISYKE